MASVTQCDVCNNVVKNEEAFYMKLYTCNKDGDCRLQILGKDICPKCKKKLLTAFGMEDKT